MDKINKQLEWLLRGDEVINTPFELSVNNQHYICTEVLRLLPGKRLVVKAQHQDGQQLVIKLFAINKKGERELAREKRGHQLATQAGVNVPQLLFSADNVSGCCAIAYDYLNNAKPFANKKKTLALYVDELLHIAAVLHNSGVVQADFHLGNVLIADGKLYLIDLASVKSEQQTRPLDKQASLANLAMLVVQFKPKQQQTLINRLKRYYRARDWAFDRSEKDNFKTYIDRAWQKRKTNYLDKRFRNCTMTAYSKTFFQQYGFRRSFFDNDDGEAFIKDIDNLVSNGQILKAGNSATVVQVTYAGKKLVIKRYNLKNFWHFLKRCYRPSRAAASWRNGCLLELLGIATPKPLGFVEKRFGWFRTTAYLVCERSGGQELATVFKYRSPTENEFSQLKNIFQVFKKYQISHGDLKSTNLLIKKKGKILLIDLDAMQEHSNQSSFLRAFNKDKHRFIRNWQDPKTKALFSDL